MCSFRNQIFFQAEDGIRDHCVTGVQTCALPILETIVYLQLVRTYKPQGYDIYYLNDRSGECDFVVCKNNQVKQAIQVSYDISSPKTRKREIEGLLLAHRKTQCTDLLLLTDHEYNQVTEKGLDIKIRPVYDWVVEMGKRI